MIDVGPATRWVTFAFEDEGLAVLVEIGFAGGEDGWPLRQVELRGPARVPVCAAALAEWPDTHEGRMEYIDRYGFCGDQPLPDDFPVEDVAAEAFESAWNRARAHLEGG